MTDPAASAPAAPARKKSPVIGAIVDYAGLTAFLIAWLVKRDLIIATWALVAVSAAALALGLILERRIAPLPLISGAWALVFGALTIVFNDPTFLKMKPTFSNLAFAAALSVGMLMGKSPLKLLIGETMKLPDTAWRTLTWRYAAFFLSMAALNEIVWRTQPDEIWVPFRFPGMLILTVIFAVSQAPLMMRHAKLDDLPPPPPAN